MIGRVVSTKTKNTATVLVERQAKHPLYKKTFIRSKKYLADDQLTVKMGDIVEIVKVRPISKNKHWKITKVLGRSLTEIAEQHLKEKGEEIIAEVMPEGKEESESHEESKESKVKMAKTNSKNSEKKVVVDSFAEKSTHPSIGSKSKQKGRAKESK